MYVYHKIGERKVKTLTRNWRDHCRIGKRKLYQNILIQFLCVFVCLSYSDLFNFCEEFSRSFPLLIDSRCVWKGDLMKVSFRKCCCMLELFGEWLKEDKHGKAAGTGMGYAWFSFFVIYNREIYFAALMLTTFTMK